VNPTRLFVLGMLAERGPMYGHQIRRDARADRTELWSRVRPGSLYGALHRMESEQLIEAVRTEQQGSLPARTVYAITQQGRRELGSLRAEALRETGLRPDPVDLALAMSADLDDDTLTGYFTDRRQALGSQAALFARERELGWPGAGITDGLIMDHALARIEAELRWHDQVLDRIGTPGWRGPADAATSAGSPRQRNEPDPVR
jgi:DNA-binding PadR family transcriptional regulator